MAKATRSSTATTPRPVPQGRDEEGNGTIAVAEPAGALGAEQERGLRREVGLQTGGRADGHLAPGRVGRPARARIDQVVLPGAGAEPAPLRASARGEPAPPDLDRFTAREGD